MRRPAPRTLSGALTSLTAELAPATALARVQEVWERVAGSTIAAAARPTAERDGVLTITCESSVWAQELTLMQRELLPRLNAVLGDGAIRELRCRTG
jgi:predicted nucleic acid-binding Zn ribbon protein